MPPWQLDIVIPVYNEGASIARTLAALKREVSTPCRVLICYDFAEDDTLPAIEAGRAAYQDLRIELVKNEGSGPHAAVMSGFRASTAPYVLMYPADDDYNAAMLDTMVARAREGADIVCASRLMPGGSMQGCPALKALIMRAGNAVLYYLARVPTHDATNGFRLFARRVIEEIPVESTAGFTYSIELLVKADRRGMRIAEVPARWFERKEGQSRFRIVAWLPAYLRWVAYAFATHLRRNAALVSLLAAAAALSLLPVLNAAMHIGSEWRGVPQSYGDEVLYINHLTEIAGGQWNDGNPYLFEHRNDPPLVLFGGNWLAAAPLFVGIPLVPALVLNFMFWSLVFVALAYWLLRELQTPRLWSAAGSLLAYLSCYGLVFRPSSRQEVYPFFLLFFIALARFIRRPYERSSIIMLGMATGATFYVFSYLWQAAVITLGLLALFALSQRAWAMLRSVLLACALGGIVGLPSLLYMLWLSHTSSYFWESLSRFGLVDTHLPMAEVVYSGGWIGLLLAFLGVAYWRLPALRQEPRFAYLALFAACTGLGLWIMQGSNLITGKLLETGEHIRPFIGPWLWLVGSAAAVFFWQARRSLHMMARLGLAAGLMLIAVGGGVFIKQYFYPYVDAREFRSFWLEQQTYAAPLRWLDAQEPEPVVVWTDPRLAVSYFVPTLTKHYMLYSQGALWTLTPNVELQERFLVAEYFDRPNEASLRERPDLFVGRQDAFHRAKTIERGIKMCRILRLAQDCGTPPTSAELLGSDFFAGMERRFRNEIAPRMSSYLQKYHVSYILKDKVHNAHWRPEELGARLVWSNERYEIYRLPQ